MIEHLVLEIYTNLYNFGEIYVYIDFKYEKDRDNNAKIYRIEKGNIQWLYGDICGILYYSTSYEP